MKYNRKLGTHTIAYDDGEEETVMLPDDSIEVLYD